MKALEYIPVIFVIAGVIFYFWDVISFQLAKWKAKKKHLATGKRYYVIPGKKKLFVLSSYQIKMLNKKLPKARRLNIWRLLHTKYYHTK